MRSLHVVSDQFIVKRHVQYQSYEVSITCASTLVDNSSSNKVPPTDTISRQRFSGGKLNTYSNAKNN